VKKTFLCGLALFFASSAFAQTTAITFPTPGQNLSIGGCTFSGVTSLSVNTANGTAITANGTATNGCAPSAPGGGATSTVGVSLAPSSYTIGDTNAANFPVVSWSSADTGVTCTAVSTSIPTGFTAVPSSTSLGSGKITLQPTGTPVANTYSVVVQCTTSTASTTVSPSTSTLSLSVGTASPPGACSASQTSTTFSNGAVLSRQCVGTIGWGQYNTSDNNVALTSLDTEMRGTFGNYRYDGLTMIPYVTAGQYISLAFTPTVVGSLQFNLNPTYGIGGTISLSTTPGSFTPVNPNCIAANGNSLNLVAGVNYPTLCSLSLGTTYYVNFAGVLSDGSQACNPLSGGSVPTSCSSAKLAYYTQ
jgi:hypothetical protein